MLQMKSKVRLKGHENDPYFSKVEYFYSEKFSEHWVIWLSDENISECKLLRRIGDLDVSFQFCSRDHWTWFSLIS